MLTVAILGRPNVGKSTLFNRLVGKTMAIVDDKPGITRDWRVCDASLFGHAFRIVDTAGLEEKFDGSISARMREQTEAGLKQADLALFMIDGREGLTAMDRHFADWLRKQKKTVIAVVNKCENAAAAANGMAEAHALGFGDPVFVSAAHGEGMDDLFYALQPHFPSDADETEDDEDTTDESESDDLDAIEGNDDFELQDDGEIEEEKSLKIAIVGRPNVGKSTLLNALIGEHRSMTGPEAGITRDAVAVDWEYAGKKFRLVDTAGMRRKARVQDTIEKLSVADSLRAIRLAQVVILVLDANAALEKQDVQIADLIIREGRALVLAVNKWDAVSDRKKITDDLIYALETSLAQVKNIPYVTLSALNGKNVTRLMDVALETYAQWNKRIKTSGLNRWLAAMESRNPPPLIDGRSNRLKYIAQIKTRPPTFALWVSRADGLPDTYKRYIINGLRETFDINGVPIRLLVRKSKNPFADKG